MRRRETVINQIRAWERGTVPKYSEPPKEPREETSSSKAAMTLSVSLPVQRPPQSHQICIGRERTPSQQTWLNHEVIRS